MGRAHGRIVHSRRVLALAEAIAALLPAKDDVAAVGAPPCRVIDIGCGDGRLAALLLEKCPHITLEGYELSPRHDALIRVHAFDGRALPLEDQSVDIAILVDVLHHTDDPTILLREAARVARQGVILKDHRLARPLAKSTLRLMDWVGNRAHDVPLPYNYWSEQQWRDAVKALGLRITSWRTAIGLYPVWARPCFEWGLHFVARIDKS